MGPTVSLTCTTTRAFLLMQISSILSQHFSSILTQLFVFYSRMSHDLLYCAIVRREQDASASFGSVHEFEKSRGSLKLIFLDCFAKIRVSGREGNKTVR